MTQYKPCAHCAVDKATCAVRAQIRDRIKGLGVTSVKFKCQSRKPKFSPGQRVSFRWTVFEEGCEPETVEFLAIVMHETEDRLRFAVRVDAIEYDHEVSPADVFRQAPFVTVHPSYMRAIAQEPRPLCPACAAYQDDPGDRQSMCWQSGEFRPHECLERARP